MAIWAMILLALWMLANGWMILNHVYNITTISLVGCIVGAVVGYACGITEDMKNE